ncbi:MAG TPA: hypothetical protein VGD84_21970 [Pseudonocardiaceae bacterium]
MLELVRALRTDSGLPDDVRLLVLPPPRVSGRAMFSVRADGVDAAGDTDCAVPAATATGAGAMPQTVQNPSSIVPAHPGRSHVVIRRTLSL